MANEFKSSKFWVEVITIAVVVFGTMIGVLILNG
jgi:hypothetical protein